MPFPPVPRRSTSTSTRRRSTRMCASICRLSAMSGKRCRAYWLPERPPCAAAVLMNIQEMSTIAQYRLPVKVFIVNNQYMGMVRQWQELLHGGRYSESYTAALPDFVKLADAFGAVGRRVDDPAELDDAIREMLDTDCAFILDVAVDPVENCFPMIPSGAAHNEMLLGPEDEAKKPVSEEGMVLV